MADNGIRGGFDLSGVVGRAAAASAPAARPAPGAPGAPGGAAGQGGSPQGISVPGLVLAADEASFDQFLELSGTVPVVVELWSDRSPAGGQLAPVLEKAVLSYGGRILLARVDVDANPQLAQAFQVQTIPSVLGLIGGRPVPLFTGSVPEEQLTAVLDQLVQLAEQNGVAGTLVVEGGNAAPAEPVEEPLPPHHAEAVEAIERGDYAAAIAEYELAIKQNPLDKLAPAGLAQVKLLNRLQGKTLDAVRAAAAAGPRDLIAQLDVADLDLSGGHVADAFDRLLTLYPFVDAEEKNVLRERLLELFEVVGVGDPTVVKARARLAGLLY